jgi:integrase
MQAKDNRRLEKTSKPGIYRRHSADCKGGRRCGCSYVVRWQAEGRPHKQMFPTWEQATEFKGALDSRKSNRKPLSSRTVADYYATWLPDYRGRTSRGLDEGTRREYEISFRKHVLPTRIARRRLRDLAPPDVRDWLKGLERNGASPITIRKAKAAVAVMLACALEDGDIATNPAHGVRYVPTEQAKATHPKRKRHQLTAADIVAILDAMDPAWRPFFTLLAQSGARVSELFGLTWGNVHLGDDPHILISEQVYAGKRKRLKTDASRARVPLSPGTAAMLADLRPDDIEPGAHVFPSATGTRSTTTTSTAGSCARPLSAPGSRSWWVSGRWSGAARSPRSPSTTTAASGSMPSARRRARCCWPTARPSSRCRAGCGTPSSPRP